MTIEQLNAYEVVEKRQIEDIHSLIYYSAGLVSSGDSMAREAALLGVPAYYLGIRYDMPANAAAAKVANLQNQKTADFATWVKNLSIAPEEAEQQQIALRQHIDEEFIDINAYMMALVEHVGVSNHGRHRLTHKRGEYFQPRTGTDEHGNAEYVERQYRQ